MPKAPSPSEPQSHELCLGMDRRPKPKCHGISILSHLRKSTDHSQPHSSGFRSQIKGGLTKRSLFSPEKEWRALPKCLTNYLTSAFKIQLRSVGASGIILHMILKSNDLQSVVNGGALSSVVEHFLHTEGAAGSSPAVRTILFHPLAP